MIRLLLALAFAAPNLALARDVVCVADQVCEKPKGCGAPDGKPVEVRLTGVLGLAPVLKSGAEMVAMEKTRESFETSRWTGINAAGETETFMFFEDRMAFRHEIGTEYVRYVGRSVRYRATGTCKVE